MDQDELFTEDADLGRISPQLLDPNFKGEQSYTPFHESAKEEVLHALNERFPSFGTDLTIEDISNQDHVKRAAAFYAASQIYLDRADDVEGIWFARYREYETKFRQTIGKITFIVNDNSDGASSSERRSGRVTELFR